MARPKMTTKEKVIKALKGLNGKPTTYGVIAKKVDSGAMAVGQICKSLGADAEFKALTKLVVSQKKLQKLQKAA